MDFEPDDAKFAVHTLRKRVGDGGSVECAGLDARPVCSGRWPVAADAAYVSGVRPFVFAYLQKGMLLQFEPSTRAYSLLGCNGGCDGGSPCQQRLAQGGATPPCRRSGRVCAPRTSGWTRSSSTTPRRAGTRCTSSTATSSSRRASARLALPLASGAWSEPGAHSTCGSAASCCWTSSRTRATTPSIRWSAPRRGSLNPMGALKTRGSLATARDYVPLGDGLLLVADAGAGGMPFGSAPPTTPSTKSDRRCRAGRRAGGGARRAAHVPERLRRRDCSCATKSMCTSQAGCGLRADESPSPAADWPTSRASLDAGNECFAWTRDAPTTGALEHT